jgi:sn-glycerol 3-phosphate transport system ATP-binding protein
MVFQSYALFPHLSVAENIVFGLRVRKVAAAERSKRLTHVAGMLGLSELLHRKPSQLSGGQQQRVALGRALIAETPVCLMDEPLSNLDAQLRLEMRREIRSLQQALGITMVYVTHDQSEAMSMADQVILLREGKIEQDGSPADLYTRPATAFTARFVGTPPMNVLTLADAGSVGVVAGTDGPSVLTGRGAGLLLGVRPEDIDLVPSGGLAAVVSTIEYLGADSIVTCGAGGQQLAVRAPRRVELPIGTRVHLAWGKDTAHVFDAATGRRRDDIPVTPLGR